MSSFLSAAESQTSIEQSSPNTSQQKKEEYFSISLDQLANIKVVTSSKREQTIDESHANITIITKELINRRGYRNIIEVLEDVPGFDFSTYEDGGGEYPVHSLNRGIGGDNGNTRLMVMVDGLVQNHISFNWAQGLTDEQMLIDVERIEIVQGPGSALYGAQAVSGIIHIITRSQFEGAYSKVLLGKNNTQSLELLHGGQLGQLYYQVALKQYLSDGDGGIGRYDPGSYFSNNFYPEVLSADYDSNGNYITSVPSPYAGLAIPDGFNNSKDDMVLRIKINVDELEAGFHYWEKKDGLGSYVVPYEYHATHPNFITHHRGSTFYLKNLKSLIENELSWHSDLWYRQDVQEPDTGFAYTYRFPNLVKSYHSSSSQVGFENHLDWELGNDKNLIVGLRWLGNQQIEQVVSLGQYQNASSSATNSSWDVAVAGGGLGQRKVNEVVHSSETAIYALFEGKFSEKLSYSIGERFSQGSDYGSTSTPRIGFIYQFDHTWLYKFLYGRAFRQPSIFELYDEFRGQSNLKPEQVDTYELEIDYQMQKGKMKFNLFNSSLNDSIDLVIDPSRVGGESYANINGAKVRGITTRWDQSMSDELSLYLNYTYQEGKRPNEGWTGLNHTAKHKLNAGVNWLPTFWHWNINFRMNYVGTRNTPSSNRYFDGEAPGYTKFDLVLSRQGLWELPNLSAQLIINNLFDEDYYGVGRQAGSSLRSEYDPVLNPNPSGFIPAYHPQPGRTFYLNIGFRF